MTQALSLWRQADLCYYYTRFTAHAIVKFVTFTLFAFAETVERLSEMVAALQAMCRRPAPV